jgi:hypothetical protein
LQSLEEYSNLKINLSYHTLPSKKTPAQGWAGVLPIDQLVLIIQQKENYFFFFFAADFFVVVFFVAFFVAVFFFTAMLITSFVFSGYIYIALKLKICQGKIPASIFNV